jgi:hypothetical protein
MLHASQVLPFWRPGQGDEKEVFMVVQDYLFPILVIICGYFLVHWMGHFWRH